MICYKYTLLRAALCGLAHLPHQTLKHCKYGVSCICSKVAVLEGSGVKSLLSSLCDKQNGGHLSETMARTEMASALILFYYPYNRECTLI